MIDEVPSPERLLAAVIALLEDEVMPQLTAPDTRYKSLVARNALEIVRRELANGRAASDQEKEALLRLLQTTITEGNLGELRQQLCSQLRTGRHDDAIPHVAATLLPSAAMRLAIDNPRYSTLQVIAGEDRKGQ